MMVVSLAAAFIVLLVKKWGVAEWMQIHGDDFSRKLFSCDLCMSFWASCAVCVVLILFGCGMHVLLFPILSTPVTRMLV